MKSCCRVSVNPRKQQITQLDELLLWQMGFGVQGKEPFGVALEHLSLHQVAWTNSADEETEEVA